MNDITDGPFTLCSSIWDEKQNRFRSANLAEKDECCERPCLSNIEECRKICSTIPEIDRDKYNLCMKKCDIDLNKACENNCTLISSNLGITNPIYKGTKELGCGDGYYESINIECLKKNKNDILKVCYTDCTESSMIDCDVYCNHFYNKLLKKNTLYDKNVSHLVQDGYKYTNSGYICKVFLYSIMITILFFLVYVIIKLFVKK